MVKRASTNRADGRLRKATTARPLTRNEILRKLQQGDELLSTEQVAEMYVQAAAEKGVIKNVYPTTVRGWLHSGKLRQIDFADVHNNLFLKSEVETFINSLDFRRGKPTMAARKASQEGVPEGHKRCRLCEQIKPIEEHNRKNFYPAKTAKDGLRNECTECQSRRETMRQQRIRKEEREAAQG